MSATVDTAALAVGGHSITAVFTGNADFNGSTSSAVTQTVGQASTTATITDAGAATVVGQSYSVSVGVAPVAPGAGVPTGTVTITDSDSNTCDVTLAAGAGSCVLPSSSVGHEDPRRALQRRRELLRLGRGLGDPRGRARWTRRRR